MSESRFISQLHTAGLISADESSILNTEIRDRWKHRGRITFKDSAQSTTAHEDGREPYQGDKGVDLQGYRDYRAVPVIGAWLWDDALGMGLRTEMDWAEPLDGYREVRNVILSMQVLLVSGAVILILVFRHRDRLQASNQAYRERTR